MDLWNNFKPNDWVQWVTKIDGRTSEDCSKLNGCCFVYRECPIPLEDTHPFCRCHLERVSKPPIAAEADIRKFTEYLFNVVDYDDGKIELFEKWGFSIEDSDGLKDIYIQQAKEKYANGDYQLGKLNEWGQRIVIEIELTDIQGKPRHIKTGWLAEPFGQIKLATPYAQKWKGKV